MALEKHQFMTVEEYFQLENSDDRRYEYEHGSAYALPDSTIDHATISMNLFLTFNHLLRGKECRVYSGNMRVEITEACYYHPDVTITCGPREPGTTELLRSPRVVVEVTLPETNLTDHARKLHSYVAHPAIEAYLLVDSCRVGAEIYYKEGDQWFYRSFARNDTILIPCLDVQFPLVDAYMDVDTTAFSDDDEFDD